MMDMERRGEPKRMNIEKRVALLVPGKDIAYPGYSQDMSDAGLCADFQKLPKEGEDVVLQVFWQEDRPPIEQEASVVWSERSSSDGLIRAGLKMKDAPSGRTSAVVSKKAERTKEKPAKAQKTGPASLPLIELGADIRLLKGGVAIETVVASIGDINEDNTVQIVLEIRDPAFGYEGSFHEQSASSIFEQDCMNHPIQDTWRALQKFFLAVYQRLSSLKSV
jgi:hypothetical protein